MGHPLAGRKQAPEHIAKRVAARLANGNYEQPDHMARARAALKPEHLRRLGNQNRRTKTVSSRKAHYHARKALQGKPCKKCGSDRHLRMALITGRGTHWDPLHGMYSTVVTDYIPLCARCHQLYDNAARHELPPTPGDT